jgi:hypothetical protein
VSGASTAASSKPNSATLAPPTRVPSSSWTATFWKPSASEVAWQTRSSSSRASEVRLRCADTSSSRASASLFAFACRASCASCTALAAWSATATRTSISSPLGRRPEIGSSTERTPSSSPSEVRIGTNSASSGCQALGSSLTAMFGVKALCAVQSNSPCGTR